MPRYFFHLRSGGRRIVDMEGSELPDLASARADALAAARQILSEKLKAGATVEEQVFSITDEAGRLLDVVSLQVTVRTR